MREPGERHRLTLPMIDRPPRRIVPGECLMCRMPDLACVANREHDSRPCCDTCRHDH